MSDGMNPEFGILAPGPFVPEGSPETGEPAGLPVILSSRPDDVGLPHTAFGDDDLPALRQAAAEAEVLGRLAGRVAACRSTDEVAHAVREVTLDLWAWDAFWIAVRQTARGWLEALVRVDTVGGRKIELPRQRAETSEFVSIGNLADGQPVLLNRTAGQAAAPLTRFGDIDRLSSSLLFAPLRLEKEILGVLSIQSYEPGFFSERDRDLLVRIAEVVAPAVYRCRAERRSAALAGLGLRLSAATSAREAARVIVDVADNLLGWDACMLQLYSRMDDEVVTLASMDLLDGERHEIDPFHLRTGAPSPIVRRTLTQGAQLILRNAEAHLTPFDPADGEESSPRLKTFGDRERRSASLMFVPVRGPAGNTGVFSIQSYAPDAYDQADLDFLQALADHCSGALERTRAEEALRESEMRFRMVAESLHDGLVLTDLSNVIVYANRQMMELTGFPVRDMLGRRAYELFLPGEEWPPVGSRTEVRRGGRSERYEVQLQRRDGSRFWSEIEASPMKNASGEIAGSLWAFADISARKQMEREEEVFSRLKVRLAGADTLEQLAEAARAAAEELWDWDSFFFSVRCQRQGAFRAILAVDTVDGLKKRFTPQESNVNTLPADHPILCAQSWVVNRDMDDTGNMLGRFGDAARLSASLMFSAVRVRGEVVGVLSVQSYIPRFFGEDQTAVLQRMADALGPAVSRCRAEDARRQTEERYRYLVERVRDGIAITREGRFDYANSRVEEILGYGPGELIGVDHRHVFSPHALELLHRRSQMRGAGEEAPSSYETTFLRRDGTLVDVEVSVTVLSDYLGGYATLAVVRDVSARRRRERGREIFADLGERLGAISTPREAAIALLEAADRLFGWDAAYCDMFLFKGGKLDTLIAYDLVGNERREVPGPYADIPGPLTSDILTNGGKIILRDPADFPELRMNSPYGDQERPSASLLYVVLRRGGESFGILSIQSYSFNAYTRADLERLQTLADYGSSALHRMVAEAELRASEERQRMLIRQMPAILWSTDRDLCLTLGAGSALALVGLSPEALTGRAVSQVFGGEEGSAAASYHRRALAGETVEYEQELGGRLLHCYIQPLRGCDGQLAGVTGLAHDVTDRRRAEEALAERARISEFSGAVGAALAAGDEPRSVLQECAEATVVHLKGATANIWLIEDEGSGPALTALAPHESPRLELYPGVFSLEKVVRERVPVRLGGTGTNWSVCDPEWVRRHGIRDLLAWPLLAGERLIGVFATISHRPFSDAEAQAFGNAADTIAQFLQRKRAEQLLYHSAYHDSLTGLPNRVTLVNCLERALVQARSQPDYAFGVLFLDLDRFKLVNDSLGHSAGDQLLIMASARLVGCLRSGDMVARLGGDEFIVFLDDIAGLEEAVTVAERILASFRDPFRLEEHEAFTGISIGIALNGPGYERPEQILRDADTALYCAKANGRQTFELFEAAMHGRALEMLRLESDLRHALERNEFSVHYQPIQELSTGRVIAFEALVRWQHPVRGNVPPEEFIPLAEENGLIVPIGWWVLQEAVERLAEWRRLGLADRDLAISVNLSPRQFRQTDLIEQIESLLNRTGVEPRCLKLEITEGTLMENAESTTAMLLQLRALDIQLLVDDFGTGHSSLSYLHRFPIHALKVDRSFIRELGVKEEGLEIVRSIVRLAHSLGLDAIAEGVETPGQEEHLRGVECDFTQGYLFSRPMDADAAAELLRNKAAGEPSGQQKAGS